MAGSSHLWTKSSKGRQFRISLSNEKDYVIEDVQRAGPMLFSKYRAQSRESAGSSDFSSLSASGVQTVNTYIPHTDIGHFVTITRRNIPSQYDKLTAVKRTKTGRIGA